jgi:hypothetical protein
MLAGIHRYLYIDTCGANFLPELSVGVRLLELGTPNRNTACWIPVYKADAIAIPDLPLGRLACLVTKKGRDNYTFTLDYYIICISIRAHHVHFRLLHHLRLYSSASKQACNLGSISAACCFKVSLSIPAKTVLARAKDTTVLPS